MPAGVEMPFVGHAEAVIDDKQRLALPAKFRARWDAATDGPSWFCIPWVPDRVLRIYPESTFLRLLEGMQTEGSLVPSKGRVELESVLLAAVEQVDVDSANRVRLQRWQMDEIALPQEVVVLGVGDRLEIRDRAAWKAGFRQGLSKLDLLAAQLAAEERSG